MIWIGVALGGYFFNAAAMVLDKYILSARIPKPSAYAFFVALFGLFGLVLWPFGVSVLEWSHVGIAILSGVFFVYGLVAFYGAVKKSEISRIAALMGALTALFLFLGFVFEQSLRGGDIALRTSDWFAFWLLLAGGILIALRLPLAGGWFFTGLTETVLAALLMALSLALAKYLYNEDGFISGFVWTRLGSFVGGMSLLLFPVWRREIEASAHPATGKTSPHRSFWTLLIFLINKGFGTLGGFLVNYAIALAPLAFFVQALSGAQFAFVFVLGLMLSVKYPKLYGEKLNARQSFQKMVAFTLIALGIFLVSGADLENLL